MLGDLFINTIRGVYKPKPTGRRMVILGHNGVIGGALKQRLEEDGHEVMLVGSPTTETISPHLFQGVEAYFVLAYDLEPIDVPITDIAFLKRLRECTIGSTVSKGVLLESIKKIPPGEPVYRDVFTRTENILSDGSVPLTSFRASVLLGLELLLIRAIVSYVADDEYPDLSPDAKNNECQPILLTDAIEYLAKAVNEKLPRNYRFNLVGNEKINYQALVDLFVAKEKKKNKALGVSELPMRQRLANLSENELIAWKVFLQKTSMDMTAEDNKAQNYFGNLEITPLFDAIRSI